MKTKFQQFKEAVKRPPPERLAKVEYKSHFFQMIGITIVCIILIIKGFWYIIFAFVFGLGISYSQGMSAFIKYNNIMALIRPERVKDYDNDISPTRRRAKIVDHVLGSKAKWIAIIISVIASFVILGNQYSRVTSSLLYPIVSILFYIGLYFFLFYWVAYPLYKEEVEVNGK